VTLPSGEPEALRDLVHEALVEAFAKTDPRVLVRDALRGKPRLPVRVVAIGKAAPAMAAGALDAWRDRIEHILVVAPEGMDASLVDRAEVVRGAHPIPDDASVRAAERCLEIVVPRAQILVLVSGGASALVCAPAKGVALAAKRDVTRAMLASGATIQEINVVRKHLSRIKGGGLLRAAGENPVLTVVASDVIGGTASDVGSGPSVPDPSTVADARALLERYAPSFASLPLAKTLSTRTGRALIVGSPEIFAGAVVAALRARGIDARAAKPSQERVEHLAKDYVALAHTLGPRTAIVRAGEPSLAVPPVAGKGGRCTHLAALVGRELPSGIAFAAIATDGVDGTSGTSGAILDGPLPCLTGADDADGAIARFDTGTLLTRLGAALPEGPAGTNYADLHVLFRT
jgi:hydroxypyruvate reductase